MVREVSEDGWGGRRQDPLAKAQVGVAVLRPHDALGAEVRGCTTPTHGIVPPGKTHSSSPSGLSYQMRLERGAEGAAPIPNC